MLGYISINTEDGFSNRIPVLVNTDYANSVLELGRTPYSISLGPYKSKADAIRAIKFYNSSYIPHGLINEILNAQMRMATTDDEDKLKEVFPNIILNKFAASDSGSTLKGTTFPIGKRMISSYYKSSYQIAGYTSPVYLFPDIICGGRSSVPISVHSFIRSSYSARIPILRDDFVGSDSTLRNVFLEANLSNSTGYYHTGYFEFYLYFLDTGNVGWSVEVTVANRSYNVNPYTYMSAASGYNAQYSTTADSIYSPGGDSSDPHNPYPGGSSPYTVDPLDSGIETDSPNTDGSWELPFDNVPDSPATVHSVNLGLYNAYALSAMQVMELANYLFSGITEVGENLVKLIWGSKRDVVISLIEFPLMVTNQGVEEIRFIFDTALAGMFHGKQLTNEYLPIDFGTIVVDRYSGTFYDFEPYTTLTLYIPYIGYIDLKPTEVIGSTLSISGYVHLTTGEINVNVKSSRTGILGSYSGTIGRMLPIADADATEIYSAIIKTAASLGAVAVAGVGAASASSAAGAVSAPSHHAVDVAQAEYQNAIKDWGAATRGIRGKQAEMMNKGVSYEAAVANYNEQRSKYNQVNKAADNAREDFHDALSEAGSNAIGAVTTGFNVSRGTVMTSSNGRLSPQRCFLRIEVPHQNVSRNQKILGYPANSSDSLNSDRLHGYTELRAIELSIPRATLTELQELENILKGGFYLP